MIAHITKCQNDVVRELMRDGASNALIAERLFITENTVKSHMKKVLTATGATNRTALVLALGRGQVKLIVHEQYVTIAAMGAQCPAG